MVGAGAGTGSALAAQAVEPAVVSEPVSVRSAGLNGAASALVGDAGAVFSNPAALATLRHIGVEGSYRRLPGTGNLLNGALAVRIRQFHLAIGGALLDHGTDPANFPIAGLPPGTGFRERLGMGTLVYRFGIIGLGGTLKYVRTNADTAEQRAISSDAGIAIAIFDILAFGFSIQNLGGNWKGSSSLEMPRLSRFGFTMNYVDPQESFRLLSTLEVQWPQGHSSRFVLGLEGGVVVEGVGIIGRGAYGSRPEGTEASRFTVGGSVAITRLSLDYAYQPADARGERVHRLGMRLTL
jgi:hypothetical protein